MAKRATNLPVLALRIAVAILFLFAALGKTDSIGPMAQSFRAWGIPLLLMYAVALVEAAGAVMLLVPRTSLVGALVLSGVMAAASLVHLSHGESRGLWTAFLLLVLLFIAGAQRSAEWTAAAPEPPPGF